MQMIPSSILVKNAIFNGDVLLGEPIEKVQIFKYLESNRNKDTNANIEINTIRNSKIVVYKIILQ